MKESNVVIFNNVPCIVIGIYAEGTQYKLLYGQKILYVNALKDGTFKEVKIQKFDHNENYFLIYHWKNHYCRIKNNMLIEQNWEIKSARRWINYQLLHSSIYSTLNSRGIDIKRHYKKYKMSNMIHLWDFIEPFDITKSTEYTLFME